MSKQQNVKSRLEAHAAELQVEVASALKRLRVEKKLTQKQLGALIGMSPSVVVRYELAGRGMRLTTIRRMASAMGKKVKITLI